MKYAARQVDSLWAVCTSGQIIANYVSESLAIQSVNEILGLNVNKLEQSTPSTFLATWTAALASTTAQLKSDLDLSSEDFKSDISTLTDELATVATSGSESNEQMQSEIEVLKDSLRVEQLRHRLIQAQSDLTVQRSSLSAAMKANRLVGDDIELVIDMAMADSQAGRLIKKLKEAINEGSY